MALMLVGMIMMMEMERGRLLFIFGRGMAFHISFLVGVWFE